MRLKDMYKADIDRDINGVIKVAQNDEASLKQELSEYIITRELRRHFGTFFGSYEKSLSEPTDQIGVWISGFFGSGKSHFLKILSYLLSNPEVAGKRAIDYFSDKFDDPMMFAQIEACAKPRTETILFNIDSKGPLVKDKTAILRVFTKVFYEHLGYYGDDIKVARLEQFIEKTGKKPEFEKRFEELHGTPWTDARDTFEFAEDDICEALTGAGIMSDTAAHNWFNGEETIEYSIELLVKEINQYVKKQGKDTRLLFMVDEVGQYIGSDSDLMLNLQSIVEEIGTKCAGRVWVMVTSQEAIDTVTNVRGNDFSKITGRFNTRLSLSSSSVDEVIKKRILAKTDEGAQLLTMVYDKNNAVLKNLYAFSSDTLKALKGYSGAENYAETYPFVPYQFQLLQDVFAQIRKHGNSGKHLSGAERSMISGFQEAAQVIEDRDEHALIPFYMFYDTLSDFLESVIRRVVDRCQNAANNHDGLEQQDVSILKLLYLIRYIDAVKSNIDNIATLMVDDIRADKINIRKNAQASLDRLLSQNYVSRNGDTWTFLTDDEQDIARDIRQTPVDSGAITQAVAQTVFDDIYPNRKYRCGKNDFPFDQFVDDTVHGQMSGAVGLRIITAATDLTRERDSYFLMKSKSDNEAILVLSEESGYFDELESALKIRRYVRTKNVAQLPEALQHIIRARLQEADAHEKRAKEQITAAIIDARAFAAGDTIRVKKTTAKDKIEAVLAALIEGVYTKFGMINQNYDNDTEILDLLSCRMMDNVAPPNAEAIAEIDRYLEMQSDRMLPTSMLDIQRRFSGIPYGWREIDIAAAVASLINTRRIELHHGGSIVQPNDRRIPDLLRRRTEIEKTTVHRKTHIPEKTKERARAIIKEYFNTMDVPSDDDDLVETVIGRFDAEKSGLKELLDGPYATRGYPDKAVVENGLRLISEILAQKADNIALLTRLTESETELMDFNDDMSAVRAFFSNQREIFDSASELTAELSGESEYLKADSKAVDGMDAINAILKQPKPYRRISELPGLIQQVRQAHDKLLDIRRSDVLADIQAGMGEIHRRADKIKHSDVIRDADSDFEALMTEAEQAKSITALDAMKVRAAGRRDLYMQKIMTVNPDTDAVTVTRGAVCETATLKSGEDIARYTQDIKEKLESMLEGHDEIVVL